MGDAVRLVAQVVDRIERARRVLDADAIMQEVAGDKVVHVANMAAIAEGRLEVVALAAVDRDFPAGIGDAAFGRDVDDGRGIEAILSRKGSGDQRQRVREPGLERLAEHRQALR